MGFHDFLESQRRPAPQVEPDFEPEAEENYEERPPQRRERRVVEEERPPQRRERQERRTLRQQYEEPSVVQFL